MDVRVVKSFIGYQVRFSHELVVNSSIFSHSSYLLSERKRRSKAARGALSSTRRPARQVSGEGSERESARCD